MAEKTLDDRVNNIIGQLRAIKRMMAEDSAACTKTIIQLKAVKAAMASLLEKYLQQNLKSCLESSRTKDKELMKKLVTEITK